VTAQRIQRKRTKGWRMPEGAVYVGRPSRWGNPWTIGHTDPWSGEPMSPGAAVAAFRYGIDTTRGRWEVKRYLRGRDLVCWCPEPCGVDVDRGWGEFGGPWDPCALPTGHDGYHDPLEQDPWCHADVLLELANR
jgi:hypothetical protein